MPDRVLTVRFYGAMKRKLRGDPWLNGLVPLTAIVGGIQGLTLGKDGTALWNHRGRLVLARVRKSAPAYQHLVFYRLRHDDLPDKINQISGAIDALDLDVNEALAEPTEIVMFVNGAVGHLVNGHAPGAGLCAAYIEEKTGVDLVFSPLVRRDVLDQIREDDQVSVVDIRVATGEVEQLGKASTSLAAAGRSAVNAPGTGSIELIYRPQPGAKEQFWDTWFSVIRQLVRTADPGTLQKVKVTRHDDTLDRTDDVDFLNAKITQAAEVAVPAGRRNVTPDVAEAAIVGAYNSLESDILEALSRAQDRGEGTEVDEGDDEDG
jgi:hypothetical protein